MVLFYDHSIVKIDDDGNRVLSSYLAPGEKLENGDTYEKLAGGVAAFLPDGVDVTPDEPTGANDENVPDPEEQPVVTDEPAEETPEVPAEPEAPAEPETPAEPEAPVESAPVEAPVEEQPVVDAPEAPAEVAPEAPVEEVPNFDAPVAEPTTEVSAE